MKTTPLAAAVLAAALLAGCSPAADEPVEGEAEGLLARYGLAEMTPQEIVDHLDASEEDRTAGPMGSVRPNELILSDDAEQISLPLPDDLFYLSFAPYITQTHDCFNHNLATCRGELAGETFDVTITTTGGETIVDQQVTSYDNGFAALWLPADIEAQLTVEFEGRQVSVPIGTSANDPTCLTTLPLQ